MRRPRRGLLASLGVLFLTVSAGLAPVASAQEEPAQTCDLLTIDEVAAKFAVTGVELTSASGSFYCYFGGSVSFYVAVQPGADLEQQRTDNPGAIDVTVGGLPALWAPDSRTLFVLVGAQLLTLGEYGTAEVSDLQSVLVALAELVIPRVPAGPSEEDVARIRALVPETIGDQTISFQSMSGEMIFGFMDAADPDVMAFQEVLAAQGKSASDVVVGIGQPADSDSGIGVLVVLIRGSDVSSLIEPFIRAFDQDDEMSELETVDLGGKQVLKASSEDTTIYGYAMGDIAVFVNGPDDFLADYFAGLP
jgi:hypothetical protein